MAPPYWLPPTLVPGRLYCAGKKLFSYPQKSDTAVFAIPPNTPLFYISHNGGWLYFLFGEEVIKLDDYEDSMHLKPFEGV